jgi:hypothetical protein
MRPLLITALFVFHTACGVQEPPRRAISEHESGSANFQDKQDSAFHSLTGWQQKVGFYVDDAAPDLVVESAIEAAETWNDAVGREALDFSGVARLNRGDQLYSSLDDTLTVLYYERRWSQTTGKSSTTLATTVWENAVDSDRIVKGDVILNAETYKFLDAQEPVPQDVLPETLVDAQTVLVHEFGHLLGLDHVDVEEDPESVMHAKTFIGPKMTSRALSEKDMSNARSLYD